MNTEHVRLLFFPGLDESVKVEEKKGKKTLVYKDELSLDRRRAFAGRPAGTECGGSCTCS